MLGVTWGVFAQWGGPDQEILRNPQNSQMVTLSVLDASPNVCYIWSGRNIQGDNKQPSVQANPIDSVSRYHVQRIGPMGVEEDEVVVRLLDSVKIVSVEPIKNCYQNNDPILMENFKVVTEPTGYENQVTVSPVVAHGDGSGDEVGKMELTFSLTAGTTTTTKKAEIDVVNPEGNWSMGMSTSAKELYKVLKEGGPLLSKGKLIEQALITMLSFTPCKPDWDLSWDFNLPFSAKRVCCNDRTTEVLELRLLYPISLSGGVDCIFPFAGVPYIASANIVLGIGGSIGVGPVTAQLAWESECFDASIPVSIGFNVSGGLGIMALSPSVLTVDVRIVGGFDKTITWKLRSGIDWGENKLSVKIVGTAKELSLFTQTISYTLCETTF